jgi:hypothetical protein
VRELQRRGGTFRQAATSSVTASNGIPPKPRPLFTFGAGADNGLDRDFDVTADGERFLFFVADSGQSSATSATLVLIENWVSELARLVPREP